MILNNFFLCFSKAILNGFVDFENFDVEEYEHYEVNIYAAYYNLK
jgi:hypothetical protein